MRLLIAEDEQELARAIQVILENEGYLVDIVHDGKEAYEYASLVDYDGLILDIMMPKLSGLEVLEKLRKESKQIPILLLTAKSAIDDRIGGLDLGADDYLTKPFAMGELLARIRAMTRRKTVLQAKIVTFEDLELNSDSIHISNGKQEMKLSNKEFQILQLLMENPKQLFSAEQLIERIWGWDANIEMNSIWVHLSNLRKKLATLEVHVRIVATRGVGYSLEVIR
ncbi:response regulator transcription factor [Carnobacterium sp. ISL-102]|uniref:response regulator transcription factor n=1 Tax=Carnobacterium sp. ISL-102 TaxID=2819142 RepID=UPI001BE5E493|nr:response regulator transcription factor [Carnobacterium sp. ISL-102]MBT2732541.1 response regulator transcription factor [Carnobacterium sp. ISL-102]